MGGFVESDPDQPLGDLSVPEPGPKRGLAGIDQYVESLGHKYPERATLVAEIARRMPEDELELLVGDLLLVAYLRRNEREPSMRSMSDDGHEMRHIAAAALAYGSGLCKGPDVCTVTVTSENGRVTGTIVDERPAA